MSGAVLEDRIAEALAKQDCIVFKRKNHCSVLAVKRAHNPKTWSQNVEGS